MATVTSLHTCAGVDHEAPMEVERTVKLGCGCTRHEGHRCDGSPMHVLTGGCGLHDDEAAA